ncbi:hypothetical protein CSW59_06875 [Caulobacter sp. BP25]|nr:hypothetical protein CSW59_06875 [Caulobacter sp. BP25]
MVELETRFKAALPNAEVARNEPKAQRISPGGDVTLFDGDPGEPEVLLSPLSYTYEHRIPVEIAAGGDDPAGLLETLLREIGLVIEADRTLGGLCSWLDAEAPSPEPLDAPGAAVGRRADLVVIATYTTRSPLA